MTTYELNGSQIIIRRKLPTTSSISVVTFASPSHAATMFAELSQLSLKGGAHGHPVHLGGLDPVADHHSQLGEHRS